MLSGYELVFKYSIKQNPVISYDNYSVINLLTTICVGNTRLEPRAGTRLRVCASIESEDRVESSVESMPGSSDATIDGNQNKISGHPNRSHI